MKIYTSTGGFGSRTFYESATQLIDVGCKYIELSSGAHVSDPKKLLTILNSRSEIMLHNYFPPPQDPFVINLGSDNPDILSRSVSLVMSAIDISSDLGLKVYGVHSGFRLNLKVEDLGQIYVYHLQAWKICRQAKCIFINRE
jgi:endonuclease IV